MKIELTYEEFQTVIQEAIKLEARFWMRWFQQEVEQNPEVMQRYKEWQKKQQRYSWAEALKALDKKQPS